MKFRFLAAGYRPPCARACQHAIDVARRKVKEAVELLSVAVPDEGGGSQGAREGGSGAEERPVLQRCGSRCGTAA